MTLSRTSWLGILAVAVVGIGVCSALYRPELDTPADAIWLSDSGPLSVEQRHTLGLKADLNVISEGELARLPGIGRNLAKNLVDARVRLNRFRSWEEVDAVRGVGPVKLKRLQELTEIHPQ